MCACDGTNNTVYELMDVMPLRLCFQLRAACLIFNVLNANYNVAVKSVFKLSLANVRRNLRTRAPLEEAAVRHERTRASIVYWGAKLWNSLPYHVRDSRSAEEFRQRYTCYMLSSLRATIDAYAPPRRFYDFV
jgi:hypothetical protein